MPDYIVTLEKLVRYRAYVKVNAATVVGAETKARLLAKEREEETDWNYLDRGPLLVHEVEKLNENQTEKGGVREAEEPREALLSRVIDVFTGETNLKES